MPWADGEEFGEEVWKTALWFLGLHKRSFLLRRDLMPIAYRILPDKKLAYIRAWEEVTVDDVMVEGARMFAETEWENGFNILCDYREVTKFDLRYDDIEKVVGQDRKNEPQFDKSKCAVVATSLEPDRVTRERCDP